MHIYMLQITCYLQHSLMSCFSFPVITLLPIIISDAQHSYRSNLTLCEDRYAIVIIKLPPMSVSGSRPRPAVSALTAPSVVVEPREPCSSARPAT